MIDIETLSTQSNAIILTIGAIKFDRGLIKKELDEMESFYVRINEDSCKKLNMHTDLNTVEWWKKQSKKAKYEVFEHKDRMDIKDALIKLSNFLKGHNHIWANSPSFDCIILENAYKQCDLDIPWKFWNLRDCRTVYDIGKVSLNTFFDKNKEDHNALNDCYKQILALKTSLKFLNI